METSTSSNTNKFPTALVWIAGIAVSVFSVVGVAAIMGWIPSSMGDHPTEPVVAKVETPKHNPVKAAQAKTHETHEASRAEAPKHIATATPVSKAVCTECGIVESVREVDTRGEGTGLGAVGGAVVGGVLGNQVGSGRGREIATVAGAVGGGLAGHQVEKYVKTTKAFEIAVRLEDGSSRTFHDASTTTWHTGDKVKIVDGALQSNS